MNNDLRFLRQQDIIPMDRLQRLHVTIIGAGAIGSITCLWLAKMGLKNIKVFDPDTVELHNWSNQVYRNNDVGKQKVDALTEIIEELTDVKLQTYSEGFLSQPLTELVISGVDSMKSRKIIWKAIRHDPAVQMYIDARMGLETLTIHTVNPLRRDEKIAYRQTLYNDNEAIEEPCTARTICYTPLLAATVVCNLVKRYIKGELMPSNITLDLKTLTLLTNTSLPAVKTR
jgi:molybdopterin-synthase adenylyltransferase